MKDITPVALPVLLEPAKPAANIESAKVEKTLAEQRAELRLQLQLNRSLLSYKFSEAEPKNNFPRSMVIRFLTQQTTLHVLKKIAYTAIGLKAFKSLQYGVTFAQFARSALATLKKSKSSSNHTFH
jgi:hypothetical protein